MASTFLPELHTGTPTVSIQDNRGLAVRELAWHRATVSGPTDTRITRHQYDIHGQLVQSTDPRLYVAMQRDNTVKPNFTWHYGLAGSPLRTESVDGGRTISLSDIEGRPLLAVTAMGVIQRWHYENDTLPGRPLATSELKPGQVIPSIAERFIWAGNTQTEKGHNLVGQCVRHYDTAGLNRLDSLSLTGATLSQSQQLLADDQEAHWEGSSEDTWQAMLAEKVYLTQSTTDATGAPLTQTDAMRNQQRLAYDVAGQLMGSWLTLADDSEQVIVKSLMYSAAGQKVREEHGNGVVTEYTYELETQRLKGITTRRPAGHSSGAKLLQDLRYEYDPVGNVISLLNEAEATRFWRNQKVVPENTYTYDTLYQLTRATGREMVNIGRQGSHLPTLMAPLPVDNSVYTNYTRTYTYDPGGNLSQIQHSAPATHNNYTTDITVSDRSNRAVLSQPGLVPGRVDALFDAGGQQKALLPGQSLVWNSRGELQQVTPVNREGGASDHERYQYGGDGMRVLKIRERQTSSAMQIQRVTYLPGLELRTTHNGTTATENLHVLTIGEAGCAQVRVLHWEGTLPSRISNNQMRYSYDNLTGSSGLELDGRGEIISQEEYYPYGGTAVWMARSQIEADYKTVRYSGKERDETGLYYYGFRYYQPWVGRWLNPDPAGTVDGLNLFGFVRNNPLTYVDDGGMSSKEAALDAFDAVLAVQKSAEKNLKIYKMHGTELGVRAALNIVSSAVSIPVNAAVDIATAPIFLGMPNPATLATKLVFKQMQKDIYPKLIKASDYGSTDFLEKQIHKKGPDKVAEVLSFGAEAFSEALPIKSFKLRQDMERVDNTWKRLEGISRERMEADYKEIPKLLALIDQKEKAGLEALSQLDQPLTVIDLRLFKLKKLEGTPLSKKQSFISLDKTFLKKSAQKARKNLEDLKQNLHDQLYPVAKLRDQMNAYLEVKPAKAAAATWRQWTTARQAARSA